MDNAARVLLKTAERAGFDGIYVPRGVYGSALVEPLLALFSEGLLDVVEVGGDALRFTLSEAGRRALLHVRRVQAGRLKVGDLIGAEAWPVEEVQFLTSGSVAVFVRTERSTHTFSLTQMIEVYGG